MIFSLSVKIREDDSRPSVGVRERVSKRHKGKT